jgi:hypothetical protein
LSKLISSVQLPREGKSLPGVHIIPNTINHQMMAGKKLLKNDFLMIMKVDAIRSFRKKREHKYIMLSL